MSASCIAAEKQDVATVVKNTLHERYPDVKILDVRPAPLPDLYEIYTGDAIAYTDDKAEYLLSGPLLETRTKRDLSHESLDARRPIDFHELPLERAIKTVKGDGKRQLAVFSDPDCPYCRKLEKELSSLDNVTIYTFLFPLGDLHPDAPRKARLLWCAKDRSSAWSNWMLESKLPDGAPCDDDPTQELQKLGQKLEIASTPTTFLPTGRRISGAVPGSRLEELLKSAQ